MGSKADQPPKQGFDWHFQLRSSGAVAVAMLADIVINYPLWIVGKRIGAGLTPYPGSLSLIYKGSGLLYVSLGPTTVIEDGVTRGLGHVLTQVSHAVPAAMSGCVAAVLVTSQVEHLITRSHALNMTMGETAKHLRSQHGLLYLLKPPGMRMMMLREIPFAVSLFYMRPILTKRFIDPDAPLQWTRELACGAATASVAVPLSQIPAVVGAYQQATGVGNTQAAIKQLIASGGVRELFRGMLPRMLSLTGTFTCVPCCLRALSPDPTHYH